MKIYLKAMGTALTALGILGMVFGGMGADLNSVEVTMKLFAIGVLGGFGGIFCQWLGGEEF